MIDILYIIGTGSIWQNNELRYSLRTIERYGENVGRIFIVGYKPDFISDEVTFIPCDDPYNWPHQNILHKVVHAIENSDIGPHFLVSSDDHFYIKPTDFANLPVYYRHRDIPDGIPFLQERNPYFLSLMETRAFLIKHGMTTFQTNPHCNTHFDADVYRANKALFDASFKTPHGLEMNCLMGNLLIAQGYHREHFHDCKLGGGIKAPQWAERVGDSNCVSGVPRIGTTYLAHWLIKNFPAKSIYEK